MRTAHVTLWGLTLGAKSTLTTFLAKFPFQNGVYSISEPRPFQHPEEAYDQQYGNDRIQLETFANEGTVLLDFLEQYGFRDSGPMLEIGCGTGRLSIPLALCGRVGELLLTDASPAFCSITARKLTSLGAELPCTSLAVLLSEDLDRLPRDTFSAVIMRAVLHHVLDIPGFFRAAGRILAPGGLLVFEEPCYEGYLVMGAITRMVPDLLQAKGISLTADQIEMIHMFVRTMQFYARRDMDKSNAEDKHLFRVDEIMDLCRVNQMEAVFFQNPLAEINKRGECLPSNYFEAFYFDYLKYCMSWDEAMLELFSEHVRPYFDYFSCLAVNNAMPHTYGTFLCRKLR